MTTLLLMLFLMVSSATGFLFWPSNPAKVKGQSEDKTVENSCPSAAVAELGSDSFRLYNGELCISFSARRPLIYSEAETFCQRHHGDLVMPKSAALNSQILDTMDDLQIFEPTWIGISDRKAEGEFLYADSAKVTLRNFNPFVNPALVDVQDCVALDPDTALWNVYRCDNTWVSSARRPFVCQYKI